MIYLNNLCCFFRVTYQLNFDLRVAKSLSMLATYEMDLVDMHSSIRFHLDCAIVQKRLSDFSKDLLTHNMNVYIRK